MHWYILHFNLLRCLFFCYLRFFLFSWVLVLGKVGGDLSVVRSLLMYLLLLPFCFFYSLWLLSKKTIIMLVGGFAGGRRLSTLPPYIYPV
ncbi:hypothetical protein FN846DRAFT_948419 [Sphaerosporella brunnea]|uniref:Uncharacterized protein n=1 Tax=Sphaerosporella brunnea TaxID=1250544 RepID=A0A5J5EXF1_9PEZI|nr:hypothetical protein FN846DRAFT_948419 [Sphaerosporella brunnea]